MRILGTSMTLGAVLAMVTAVVALGPCAPRRALTSDNLASFCFDRRVHTVGKRVTAHQRGLCEPTAATSVLRGARR